MQQILWALSTLNPCCGIHEVWLGWTTDRVGLLETGNGPNSEALIFKPTKTVTQLPRSVTEVCPEPQECLGHCA